MATAISSLFLSECGLHLLTIMVIVPAAETPGLQNKQEKNAEARILIEENASKTGVSAFPS